MRARPVSLTLVGWLFIVTGVVGAARGAWNAIQAESPLSAHELGDLGWLALSEALAVSGGVATLLGRGWARCVLLVWMVGHLVISALHSVSLLLVHVAIFAPIVFLLFRPAATEYFRRPAEPPRA